MFDKGVSNKNMHFVISSGAQKEPKTLQIANELKEALQTEDVAVVIDAQHMCVQSRGIRDSGSSTVTAFYGGKFEEEATKREFLSYLEM